MTSSVAARRISSPIRKARSVSCADKVVLYALAAGRCSFRGCNDNIVEHHLTRDAGNYGETAHIYAFSDIGPRGKEPGRPNDPDTLENLILLCPKCHKLVDTNEEDFSVDELRRHRAEHEARVRRAVDIDIEHKTLVLTLSSPIAGQPNAIPHAKIISAIHPRYLAADIFEIKHTLGPDEAQAAVASAADHITRQFDAFLTVHERAGAPPISVFGIAPIPLLVHLGTLLGNKRESALFQRHRDDGGWAWKNDGDVLTFSTTKLREGSGRVALLVNVSGKNQIERLPPEYEQATVYEIAPVSRDPDRALVRRHEELANFRTSYRQTIEQIRREKNDVGEVGLFPAVPIPFAIAMGSELLPKADPVLVIHDWRKEQFIHVLTVNT